MIGDGDERGDENMYRIENLLQELKYSGLVQVQVQVRGDAAQFRCKVYVFTTNTNTNTNTNTSTSSTYSARIQVAGVRGARSRLLIQRAVIIIQHYITSIVRNLS